MTVIRKPGARAVVEEARARWEAAGRDGGLSVPLFDLAEDVAREGRAAAPLAGITAVVKDMFDVAGAPCCAGLSFLREYRPARDAALVRRLRAAGALIVGLGASDTAGFGVRTPSVRNPRWPRRTAGGSSGGTAAAIAAGIARVGLGSDTGGSVRIPAACCGVVGFKPTFGALPVEGIRPLAPTLDHAGILGADVESAARAFDAVTPSRKAPEPSSKPVIGFEPEMMAEASPAVRSAFQRALDACARRAAAPSPTPLPGRAEYRRTHRDIFVAESAFRHGGLLENHPEAYRDEAAGSIRLGLALSAHDYLAAMERARSLRATANELFRRIDLLLTPAMPVVAPARNTAAMAFGGRMMSVTAVLIRNTAPFNITGQPALSLPIPEDKAPGPASVQIVGRCGEDALVLAFARRLSDAMASG